MGEQRLELPVEPRSVARARAFVRDCLAGEPRDAVDDVVLLTSELVTNVLLHTRTTPVVLLLRERGAVRITVEDGSPALPRRRQHSSEATTGRGVELLQHLAADWGWAATATGKAVWFSVALPERSRA